VAQFSAAEDLFINNMPNAGNNVFFQLITVKTSCAGGHHMPMPPVTLTFWPWKWRLSRMWRGLPLCQF